MLKETLAEISERDYHMLVQIIGRGGNEIIKGVLDECIKTESRERRD